VDVTLTRALAAAARAFAEEIERDLPVNSESERTVPTAGSPQSMLGVLRSVAKINDELARGASDEEIRQIARRAGMDPRGMAGYYSSHLLEKRLDGRWLSGEGRERLGRLEAVAGVVIFGSHTPDEPH
jgi:hypothetical protein